MDWFLKTAAQDHPEAQSSIGDLYTNGQRASQDYTQAIERYQKAANKGLSRAQINMGDRYYHGEEVSPDYSQAIKQWTGTFEHPTRDMHPPNTMSAVCTGTGSLYLRNTSKQWIGTSRQPVKALAVALTFATSSVSAMNSACDECSSANAKASSPQCNTTLTDKNKELTIGDLACLKSLVANTAWIQSCVKPDACTAEDVTFAIGSYTMAIQVLESSALPDSPSSGSGSSGSGSGATGGNGASGSTAGANSSGSNGSTSGAAGGRVLGSSEKMVALGALVAMAAAGVV
ncbi:hypothetical protein BGZ97_013034 [Linnemannia gamsii]|uniref:HCP-like protein n=1 Tax=Linnemannia gamsii TaxID=64522 RepID=A0A9P6R229_9FUNG|nr:hypothetical protein BGZ97_013034 [Linnemannia gamsii]